MPFRKGEASATGNKSSVSRSEPLSTASIARYCSELAGCFKYAKKQKLTSRNWVPPTRGAHLPEQNEPDQRYFDSSQVANLVKIARMLDKSWVRIPALIELVFCTGLLSGGLKALISSDGDLAAGVLTVEATKSGDPIIVPLSSNSKFELEKLLGKVDLIFVNKDELTYQWRKIWDKITIEASFPRRHFHLLCHSC